MKFWWKQFNQCDIQSRIMKIKYTRKMQQMHSETQRILTTDTNKDNSHRSTSSEILDCVPKFIRRVLKKAKKFEKTTHMQHVSESAKRSPSLKGTIRSCHGTTRPLRLLKRRIPDIEFRYFYIRKLSTIFHI